MNFEGNFNNIKLYVLLSIPSFYHRINSVEYVINQKS